MAFLSKIGTLPNSECDRITAIIKAFCDQHDIKIKWVHVNYRAHRLSRTVWIPRINHYYEIATCLQEIGHILAPQDEQSEMNREYEACAWAVQKASEIGIPFDKSCWAQLFRSLNAYAQKHAPPQDHPAWILLKKAQTLGEIGEPANIDEESKKGEVKKAEGKKKRKTGKKAGKKNLRT
jgi:hypothetical protein